ncbi:hypothetical protein HGI30_16135 [Paenibacillus albicereus]|uniref:SPOR domain-containing protein n=1 Tax=Paenibacillus albicereus TaxID=2726185 RepID=A0A6H2GZW1_9BACL|nr:SPOR domain-containing protein [Paenibacillus albicereus]QJC52945.1 hypothetical protein HGI30_16135 [Paenibacillus albicereus]
MTKVRVTYRPDGSGRLVQEGRAASGLPRAGSEPRPGLRSAGSPGAAAGMEELSAMSFAESYEPWVSPFQDNPIGELELAPGEIEAAPAEGDAADEDPAWTQWPGEAAAPELDRAPYEGEARAAGPEATEPERVRNGAEPTAAADEPGGLEQPSEWLRAVPHPSTGRLVQDYSGRSEIGYDEPGAWPSGPVIEPDAARPARAAGKSARAKRAARTAEGPGPSWLKVLLSIAGAIATGAVLGYMTLTLFAGQGLMPDRDKQAADASAAVRGGLDEESPSSAAAGSETAAKEAATVRSVAAGWPERTYQLLQYGVFSSKASAEAAAAELKKAGLASALRHDGDYRVYAGVAGSRAQAEQLAGGMTGTEVYLKGLKLPSVPELAFAGTADQLNAYDEGASGLIGDLAGQTAALLAGDAAKSDAASRADWTKRLDEWLKTAADAGPNWSGKPMQGSAGALADALRQAGAELKAYEGSPKAATLWAVQAQLTAAALAQLELREAALPG